MTDYLIDDGQLAVLRKAATRLYSEQRMNGDEMRDMAHALSAIADRCAQVPIPDEQPPARDAVAENEELVVLESMPLQHRARHKAARNWGVYPANGAHRFVMPRVEAQEVVDSDSDEYDRIVRVATSKDVEDYGTEARPEGW